MFGKTVLALSGALLIATIAIEAHAFQSKDVKQITIRNNRGGHLLEFSLRAKKLARDHRHVRIAGRCSSACTMYLTMPRELTCITPAASFGFHLPYGASRKYNAIAANYMLNSYPKWVRNWIANQNGLSRSIKTMPYSYARKFMKVCGSV